MKNFRELKSLLKYFRRYRVRLMWGVVAIILTQAFSLLSPRFIKYAIDSLNPEMAGDTHGELPVLGSVIVRLVSFLNELPVQTRLIGYAVAMMVAVSLAGYCRYWMRQTIIVVSRKIEYDLRNDFFTHVQKMSLPFFHQYPTGDLMARATNDLNSVRGLVGPSLMYSINTVMTFLFIITVMILISLKLTLLALITVPLIVLLVYTAMQWIYKGHMRVQEKFSEISTLTQENLAGIRVIKAFVREKSEIERFRKLNTEYVDENMFLVKVEGAIFPLVRFMLGGSILIVIWMGGNQVIAGEISLGNLVAFNTYLGMLSWPIISVGWILSMIQRGTASLGRINRIFEKVPVIQNPAIAYQPVVITPNTPPQIMISEHNTDFSKNGISFKEMDALVGDIEFRNVTFGYNKNKSVLNNINLKIPHGSTVAIVGYTGSGKSSLVNLIPRLYDVSSGQLLIDGVDVREIPLDMLRRQIGFVPQESFLFSTTLAENITYGLKTSNQDEMIWAANIAQLYKDVKDFPHQFDTILGERGITLSGGQKQRSAIARAIARHPAILILDDALSSVDTYTEEQILRQLWGVMAKRTSLVISHRISTIKDADLIVVLDEGRIVERGNHESLLAYDGIYADLYQKQLLREALEL